MFLWFALERGGHVDNMDAPAVPSLDNKPSNETEQYNFSTNPRSVSSSFPIEGGNSQAHANLDSGLVTTDTQFGGISSTSNAGSDSGKLLNVYGY